MTFEIDFEKCTGCSACSSICPKQCIIMESNEEGFLYPNIDEDKCISCGLCKKICPINSVDYYPNTEEVMAYQNSDSVREHSTSGGFFTLISDYVLENDGIVYGAAYDEGFSVKHIRTNSKGDRDFLCYSKYVQSNVTGIFERVIEDLKSNRLVLFTGTPCQVSGLKKTLKISGIETSKLITCDFICHGVPSPLIWKEYINFLEDKYNDKIISVNFRDKRLGWHKPSLVIEMKNHFQALTEENDPFYQLFYSNCILRKSCHVCDYSKISRVSDITMGDCWGIEVSNPKMDDDKGLSLVMINSNKGKKIIEKLNCDAAFRKISFSDLRQPHLYAPARISRKREKFWKDYNTHQFIYILNKYGNYSFRSKLINGVKKLILKVIT